MLCLNPSQIPLQAKVQATDSRFPGLHQCIDSLLLLLSSFVSVLCLPMAFSELPRLLLSPNHACLVTLMMNSAIILASFRTASHLVFNLLPRHYSCFFPFSLTFNLRTGIVTRKLQRNTSMSPGSFFPDSSRIWISIAMPTLHQANDRNWHSYTKKDEHSASVNWYS